MGERREDLKRPGFLYPGGTVATLAIAHHYLTLSASQ